MRFEIVGLLRLTRPANLVIAAGAIFVGALAAGSLEPHRAVLLACVSGMLVMAGGNAINDYFDRDIDAVNKVGRPIPSGRIPAEAARRFSIILFVLGTILSIFISKYAAAVALCVSVGLFLYSARLKRMLLLGNIAVSLFSAAAFAYGGLAVGRVAPALIPAVFAFLFHLGREVVKDIEDRQADASYAAQTLPIRFGDRVALTFATVVFAALISFTFVPYLLKIYGEAYLWLVLFGVDAVILIAVVLMWLRPTPLWLNRVSLLLKADMLVGLVAIYVGLPG